MEEDIVYKGEWFLPDNLDNKIKGGTILIKGSHSTKMDVLSDAL